MNTYDYVGADGQYYSAVGSWAPFLLGLPAGGLGGYFLRKWQENHPGQALPGIPPGRLPAPNLPSVPAQSGEWVGGPWLDIEERSPYTVGGPWLDIEERSPYTVGGPWLDIEERSPYTVGGPWLDIEERPPYTVGGPWLDIEERSPYTVGGPWLDIVGAQAEDRSQRQTWAQIKALIQSAISEVNDMTRLHSAEAYVWSLDPPRVSPRSRNITLEGSTFIEAFDSPAEALDYMRERIQSPHVALALFDRRSPHWPNPTNWTKSNDPAYEPIIAQQIAKSAPTRMLGHDIGALSRQTAVGSALDEVRARAKALASSKPGGMAAGSIHLRSDGRWHTFAFATLDDAIDWLQRATQDRQSFTYAAAFEKGNDGRAYIQDEEIGGMRGLATTMGGHGSQRNPWRAA